MTVQHHGGRAKDRGQQIGDGVLAVILAASVAALFAANAAADRRQRNADIAEAKGWTIVGPPCPGLSRRAYLANLHAADLRVARAFNFDGVRFARAYGDVSCEEIHDDGGQGPGVHPVCQFTSPAALEVTTPRGEFYFFPQAEPATITVFQSRPECVLASRFTD